MCYTIQRLFSDLSVNAAVHELDQEPNGRELESQLKKLGCNPVVPAVFIGGEFVGGTNEVMELHLSGSLVPWLRRIVGQGFRFRELGVSEFGLARWVFDEISNRLLSIEFGWEKGGAVDEVELELWRGDVGSIEACKSLLCSAKMESSGDGVVAGGSRFQSHVNSNGVSTERIRAEIASDTRDEIPGALVPNDGKITSRLFSFDELVIATEGFHYFLGEGGFGPVYKGYLESTGQVNGAYFGILIQRYQNGLQGTKEFFVEVLLLSNLHHENLVTLVGYCYDGDQRLLVYEFMPLGSLEDHLHDLSPGRKPLDWNTRMKIAADAARGLDYLHNEIFPSVIFRDMKSSNILLSEGFHAKLSDFGLAKLGPKDGKTHVSTRVMGTYGYCAPEYAMTGQLTTKSDIYSFGVVFLEIITGRKAIDETRSHGDHNLVAWARPLFKDRKKFHLMADPHLRGRYPIRGLYQALAVAAMCLQEEAATRPLIADVVTALDYLANQKFDPNASRSRREDFGQNGSHGSPSSHHNSPKTKGETGIAIGNQLRLDELQRPDSRRGTLAHPARGRDIPRNISPYADRERVVTAARLWGENWRGEKHIGEASNYNSTHE
ncbi:hypothetical protein Sjap_007586 [Stephania japonica]|uniref:Protein kinase domain-containing protein n=1 Tax=Stephania japonica TaxID=461633 RepID=A0AAP0JN03_9MAGN